MGQQKKKIITPQKGSLVKRKIAPLIFVMSLATLVLADDKKDNKFDAAKMVGDWTIIAGAKMGEKVEGDHLKVKVKVTKETFILDGEAGKFVMGYKLDTAADPVSIDMEIKEKRHSGRQSQRDRLGQSGRDEALLRSHG